MEIGIDSFAAASIGSGEDRAKEQHECVGRTASKNRTCRQGRPPHFWNRRAPPQRIFHAIILAGAAARKNIRLTSAVTVLSAADPVRVFQSFATLDLVSRGRAEMVVGRGSFIEAFPLFGLTCRIMMNFLKRKKLDLLLKIRNNELVTWSGKFRPPLHNQAIYPRPLQDPFPIWLGVGGTPASFVRAGTLGLPLMVAVIGGETHRFRPLVDLYREAGKRAVISRKIKTRLTLTRRCSGHNAAGR